MTSAQLALIAGVILSLLFSYVPGLNVKFAALSSEVKRLTMLLLVILVGAVSYGLVCTGLGDGLSIGLTCTKESAITLIMAVIDAAIANQTAYALSPQTTDVKAAKAARG